MQRIGRPGDMALNGKDLLAKVEIIQRYFPPSIAHLFALPKERNGALEWWTPLQGQPIAFNDLPSQERQKLLQRVQQRLDGAQQLSEKLVQAGHTQDAQALQSLLGQPAPENLWSVNGEPLITAWGKPEVSTPVASAAKPVVEPPPEKPKQGFKLRWWWLLLPLLLLLLAWLLWWWWMTPQRSVAQAPDVPFQCSKDGVPPDFVMVIDTSGSMALNMGVSEVLENMYLSTNRAFMPTYLRSQAVAEPSRMTVAKQALEQVIDGLHPSITTQVITLGDCRKTTFQGSYTGKQRGQLQSLVQSLNAHSETPIAQSLRHASSLVDGKERDAMVLLFVDGEDGCQENVCEVSAGLHAKQPRMRINVVNIGREPLSNCIAQNTGGRVYTANDAQTVIQHLADATNELMQNRDCTKP
ncbi:MAG: VWA domain-containing protein [Comamonas sp.]|nr:VWA domain-containing protein [Candidatus Comamonas equi]